ncbi:MAG TPA: ATP-binding protein [Rhodanobacteraceae bacterium]|nr:ATP-binding protein [Rhodanobacteraceae bacterium]
MNSQPRSAPASTGAPATSPADLDKLVLPAAAIAPDKHVLDVGERVLDAANSHFLSLPIVARGMPVGSISRYELMRIYLMPYGRELYGRRPISAMMNRRPLVLRVDTPIDEAARAISGHITSPITEDFIVTTSDGRYLGVGAVLDVLRAVEGRLTRHGVELERAHARLKASQTQLVQSEKMASLGQMVAGLVHEINTPLGYVRNNVEMTRTAMSDAARLIDAQELALAAMLSAHKPGPDLRDRLDDIEALKTRVDATAIDDLAMLLDDTLHGVGQIGELVANLKDFSRLDQARSDRANLNTLLDGALRIVQHLVKKRDIEVVRHSGELPDVECAPAQINQVLLNLLGNAIQAIEHAEGRITVRTQALDGRVMVLVEDNGKGIAAEHLPRIFDPFFTTKPVGQGTGLGLSIAHQIVEQHGGVIRVASKPGTGTRFLVALPAASRA